MITEQLLKNMIAESVAQVAIAQIQTENETPSTLVPDGFEVVNLESYMDRPRHKRGTFFTKSLGDFAAYIKGEVHEQETFESFSPSVFINAEKQTARAIIDFGTAGAPAHGLNQAEFSLKLTAEYNEIIKTNKLKKSQLDFTFWLDDMAPHIACYLDSEGNPLEPKLAIAALRKVTFSAEVASTHEESDFAKRQTGLAAIAVKSDTASLPARIVFKVAPSADLSEMEIGARVKLQKSEKDVLISYEIALLEKHEQDLAEAFRDAVMAATASAETAVNVFIGMFQKG